MKKSHKKLLFFQIILIILLLINSFVSNVLTGYKMVFFLGIILVLFKFFFGFEKDKSRYVKDIIFEIIIFLLVYFLVYYLFGILTGFTKTSNYYTVYSFFVILIPIVLNIILKEVLRYMMMKKSEGCLKTEKLTFLFFLLIDITNAIYYQPFDNGYNIFLFISLVLLPSISTNIMCSYLCKRIGYRPIIFYLVVIGLYPYLLPLVPNPNEYIRSVINFLIPLILMYKISSFFKRAKDERISRDYNKRRILSYAIPLFLIILIIYFTSGYFKYYAIAIASGSMEPKISKGDVVIIEKIGNDYDSLKEEEIIAYKYNNVIIVHRIERILNDDGVFYFYTKGDANKIIDNYVVTSDMILGVVNFKVPFVGLPTVWLNEV